MKYIFTYLGLIPFYIGLLITTIIHWFISVPLLLIPLAIFREVTFNHFVKSNVDITKSLWEKWI